MSAFNLFGIKIHESPFQLKKSRFRLSDDVPLSDSFRREMQAWCDDFFGTDPCVIVTQDGAFLNREQIILLKGLKP